MINHQAAAWLSITALFTYISILSICYSITQIYYFVNRQYTLSLDYSLIEAWNIKFVKTSLEL